MTAALVRMRTAVIGDFRLEWRFGFFAVGVFVTVQFCALLRWFVTPEMGFALPAFVLGNLAITTFFFVACLVLFEKGEGTLEAVVVTPMRAGEYLGSKIATLTLLATVETLLIIGVAYPGNVDLAPMLFGTVAMSIAYVLYGFAMVARFDSITDFLLPSVLFMGVWQLPVLDSLGLVESWLFRLHPSRPMLLLVEGSIRPLSAGEWVYAIVYTTVSIAVLGWVALRAFDQFVIRKQGQSR